MDVQDRTHSGCLRSLIGKVPDPPQALKAFSFCKGNYTSRKRQIKLISSANTRGRILSIEAGSLSTYRPFTGNFRNTPQALQGSLIPMTQPRKATRCIRKFFSFWECSIQKCYNLKRSKLYLERLYEDLLARLL